MMSDSRSQAAGHSLAALDDAFRASRPPSRAPNGVYAGKFLALDIAPGLTQLYSAVAMLYMPWKGKRFDAAASCGDNLLRHDFYWTMRLLWPLYRGDTPIDGRTFRAFTFKTSLGPGLEDPDRQVLRLNYDLPGNPRFSVRRIVDELVQVNEGYLLGKAHVRWWWGRWQRVAFFSLSL